jgi:hypothetical protein
LWLDKEVRKAKGTWEGKRKEGYPSEIWGNASPDTVPASNNTKGKYER